MIQRRDIFCLSFVAAKLTKAYNRDSKPIWRRPHDLCPNCPPPLIFVLIICFDDSPIIALSSSYRRLLYCNLWLLIVLDLSSWPEVAFFNILFSKIINHCEHKWRGKVFSSEPVWVEEFYPGTGNPSYSSWAVMSAINIKRIHTTQLSTAMIRLWRKNDVTGAFGVHHHHHHHNGNILEDWDIKFILIFF